MLGKIFPLLCLAWMAIGAPVQFEVHELPGWKGELPSKVYSGFTKAGAPPGYPKGEMHVHWMFLEAETNSKTAPVVVWYNGGPGASSMFGLLVELGPFMLNVNSLDEEFNRTGVPTLLPNPYSWTKVANVLIVNNPPPVGFSYCDPVGPSGDGTSCGSWDDSLVATTNHAFLANWIGQFAEFADNEMYITGESYAGIYVPIIVRECLGDARLNIKGFAVGDGCMGTEVLCGEKSGPYYELEFMHGHGQFSQGLNREIRSRCPEAALRSGDLSAECEVLIKQMREEVGGYFAYNLYDECVYSQVFNSPEERSYWSASPSTSLGAAQNDYPCPGPAMNLWLNQTSVRKALHVPDDAYFFSGDNGAGFNYTLTEPNVLPFYLHVARNTSLRVLVYNGDTDPGLNSMVTQDKYFEYFAQEGLRQKSSWRPWTLDGKQMMGGYVTEFDGDFSYLTIRGSGHMVPEFKPAASLEFLTRFLRGEQWQPYVPPQ